MKKEQDEGGQLISSIESLDFSVNSENDVEITIKILKAGNLTRPPQWYRILDNSIPQLLLIL